MRTGSRWLGLVLSVSLILVAMAQARQRQTGAAISIDDDDIGGVVTSDRPEAGVWVIAETMDLPIGPFVRDRRTSRRERARAGWDDCAALGAQPARTYQILDRKELEIPN